MVTGVATFVNELQRRGEMRRRYPLRATVGPSSRHTTAVQTEASFERAMATPSSSPIHRAGLHFSDFVRCSPEHRSAAANSVTVDEPPVMAEGVVLDDSDVESNIDESTETKFGVVRITQLKEFDL